jgi:hypothetical protein
MYTSFPNNPAYLIALPKSNNSCRVIGALDPVGDVRQTVRNRRAAMEQHEREHQCHVAGGTDDEGRSLKS